MRSEDQDEESPMPEMQTERPFRIFYYGNVADEPTKLGYMAADALVLVGGLWFLWALFWPHHW
jgi:hypothetical protein